MDRRALATCLIGLAGMFTVVFRAGHDMVVDHTAPGDSTMPLLFGFVLLTFYGAVWLEQDDDDPASDSTTETDA